MTIHDDIEDGTEDPAWFERPNFPIIAAVISLIVPGGGQYYNRYFLRGLVVTFGFAVATMTIGPFAYAVMVAGAIEALIVSLYDQGQRS